LKFSTITARDGRVDPVFRVKNEPTGRAMIILAGEKSGDPALASQREGRAMDRS